MINKIIMSDELCIRTYWLESGTSIFKRVVVLKYDVPYKTDPIKYIAKMLYDELGINNNVDYIFDVGRDSFINYGHVSNGLATIRLKEEGHFIMLKLHYDGN
jgi:hypothetical protein